VRKKAYQERWTHVILERDIWNVDILLVGLQKTSVIRTENLPSALLNLYLYRHIICLTIPCSYISLIIGLFQTDFQSPRPSVLTPSFEAHAAWYMGPRNKELRPAPPPACSVDKRSRSLTRTWCDVFILQLCAKWLILTDCGTVVPTLWHRVALPSYRPQC
jgi:hypothetical protein